MEKSEQYRVLILGNSYSRGSCKNFGPLNTERHRDGYSTAHLKRFADACDAFVLSLDTPLINRPEAEPPIDGQQVQIGWNHPERVISELQHLGVDSVSLANAGALDHGVDGLEAAFKSLADSGIAWFGAGQNLTEAREPYRLALPEHIGGGEIHFHGGYQYPAQTETKYQLNADHQSAGRAPLKVSEVPHARAETTPEDSFHVAFPHWGEGDAWRSSRQFRSAHRYLRKDYDLVLGHGGFSVQEVHRKLQRWVVYGLGRGTLCHVDPRQAHKDEKDIAPFSFWSILEVNRTSIERSVSLKLYPVYSDTSGAIDHNRAVTADDFNRLIETLGSRPARPWRFFNPAQTRGTDDLGHFIELQLGRWPEGRRPSRLEPLVEGGDPGDWPLRSPSTDLEDRIIGLNKHMGASALAVSAEADEGNVHWVSYKVALVESRGKRLLAHAYRVHESALSEAIVKDKVLAAELLESHGVATPKTVVVKSAQAAVDEASKIPGPVVLKPRDGNKSRGVSTNLVNEHEIRLAFTFARSHGSEVILQQHIDFAEELRVMASPQQAVAVNARVLPHVVGDGVSTVKQLIEDKNLQRSLNPSLRQRPIPVDELTRRKLRSDGLSLNSVLDMGQKAIVRGVAGLGAGGDTYQNLKGTSDHLKQAAVNAVAAIPGMDWGGVDLIIQNGTAKPYVIEVNATAAYGAALFPAYGEPKNVGTEVWKLRYAATRSTPEAEPKVPDILPHPLPLVPDTFLTNDHEGITFDQILESSLRRQNYTLELKSPKVWRVFSPQGSAEWITKTGFTKADRAAVERTVQRHSWVYELFKQSDIPRPRARTVSAVGELTRFVKTGAARLLLAPVQSSWTSARTKILTVDEALSIPSLTEKTWVQSRYRGYRVRVMATETDACAITSRAHQGQLDPAHVADASRLAVQAVRAVPELRWAIVDVLIRPNRLRAGQTGGLLVEGLTATPRYTAQDRIIAGDLDWFCSQIMTSSASWSG